ncbi:MAG: hypothetical protein WCK89_03320 [bacterium]
MLGLWLGIVVPCLMAARRLPRRFLILALSAAVVTSVLMLTASQGVHHLACLSLGLCACGLLRPAQTFGTRVRRALALSAALSGLYLVFRDAVPCVPSALERASLGLCIPASYVFGKDCALGPDFSGVQVTIFFILCHLSLCAVAGTGRTQSCARWVGGQCFLVPVYVCLRQVLVSQLTNPHRFFALGDTQAILFLLGLSLVVAHAHSVARTLAGDSRAPSAIRSLSAVLAAAACGLVLAWPTPVRAPGGLRVLFHDTGFLDWTGPNFDRFGGLAGGMLGWLPKYLAASGHSLEIAPATRQTLRGKDVLIVFNPQAAFSGETEEAIWEFVREGGGLLALGDHTCRETIRGPLNSLLERVGVSLNFDSAIFLADEWRDTRLSPHFARADAFSPRDTQVRIGASLDVSFPARPVIVGVDGFSDKGVVTNRAGGYLGDMRYSIDERLGDVILAASAVYGKGRVVVFGDTTSLQNGSLPWSDAFVNHVLSWLSARRSGPADWGLTTGAGAVLVLVLVGAGYAGRPILACSLAALVAAAGLLPAKRQAAHASPKRLQREAYVDVSHLERLDSNPWHPDGLGGLLYNLMRSDILPRVTCRFPDLGRAGEGDLVILVAPARPFTGVEMGRLDAFVARGGMLVLCVTSEDIPATRALLNRFGFRVLPLPLGAVTPEHNSRGLFFTDAWAVQGEGGNSRALCDAWEHPAIVLQPRGRGRVLLIGDKGFLFNRNLESVNTYVLPNILFLKEVFAAGFGSEK